MSEKLARLRFTVEKGMFVLSKLTDIETGLVIPITSIKFEKSVDDLNKGDWDMIATVTVPIEEIDAEFLVRIEEE